ncbi:hypothetical protein FACS1894104_4900 [Actinomycetota bacterium]|nr:hypothetical protein FACS1894104_4900 [Actinomycetota bacterium]
MSQSQSSQQSTQKSTQQYVQIAYITKAKGLKGQFVAQSCNELFALSDAVSLEVWVVPPSMRGVRRATIVSVEQKPGTSDFLLRISGVDDLTAATELAGRYLLAKVEDLGTWDKGTGLVSQSWDTSPVPLSHKDAPLPLKFTDVVAGDLGELIRVDHTPAYELWVVDGSHGELLIPAVDEYVVEETPGLITLELPKGFLEINS